MSMQNKFSRSELQSVSCKIIRLPSLRVQMCDHTGESDGKLDGIAEGKLDGKLIKNVISHRFLPDLVSSFYEKHPLE